MERLGAIIIGVVMLGLAEAALERRGGALGAVAAALGLVAGCLAGIVVAIGSALVVVPGACVAVLCPTCYGEPSTDDVWQAGLVYFAILGALAGLLPGRAYRLGFTLSAAVTTLASVSYWSDHGAGATILVGVALTALGWTIHHAASASRCDGDGGSGSPGGPVEPASTDFWDGASWRAARLDRSDG